MAITGQSEVHKVDVFVFMLIPESSVRPMEGPRGPGRKTKLNPCRITQGIYENGDNFHETDE